MIQTETPVNIAKTILNLQAKDKHSPYDLDSFDCEWNNYWENVIRKIQKII